MDVIASIKINNFLFIFVDSIIYMLQHKRLPAKMKYISYNEKYALSNGPFNNAADSSKGCILPKFFKIRNGSFQNLSRNV